MTTRVVSKPRPVRRANTFEGQLEKQLKQETRCIMGKSGSSGQISNSTEQRPQLMLPIQCIAYTGSLCSMLRRAPYAWKTLTRREPAYFVWKLRSTILVTIICKQARQTVYAGSLRHMPGEWLSVTHGPEHRAQDTTYPSRKSSLIEDAQRDSARASLDFILPVSCSPTENDDVFSEDGEGLHDVDHMRRVCITFSSKDGNGFGALAQALKILELGHMALTHIESRPSDIRHGEFDFLVQCETQNGSCGKVASALAIVAESVMVRKDELSKRGIWFPKKISDLDKCTHLLSNYDPDLDDEHPGSKDAEYIKRRTEIAALAFKYKHGDPLPRVEYTEEETKTWTHVFRNLTRLFPTHACQQFLDAFDLLDKAAIYREDHIPQLEEVSQFLKARTGFQLRPVAGLLSARDFLASLAFRVFQTTQYVRHRASPMHTPEPDTLHELLGHVPMLADPGFAQFSQEIGLASLGVSDEDITKLSTLYWFTVEFGLCMQNGEVRACGAGLLSAYGELQYALSDQPEHRPFDPAKVAVQEYQDKNYQPIYFVASTFEDAKQKLKEYASNMRRPYIVRYDGYTECIQVLDRIETVRDAVRDLKGQLDTVTAALNKITTRD